MNRVAVRALAAAIVACTLAHAAPGSADAPRRVALVSPGAELESAARAALQPWGVEVLVVSDESPGPTAPDGHAKARALAGAYDAAAVIWVSEHAGSHALWVYDRESDQVIARELQGAPPFDAPAAAAVALSVKTLLRHSATAPATERYGAESAANAPVQRNSAASPGSRAPAADRDASDAGAAGTEPTPSPFELAISGGLRFGLTRPSDVETRFALEADFWPGAGALGVFVRGAIGPGIAVADRRFQGRFADAEVGAGAQLRGEAWQRLRGVAAAGFAAHVTSLDGAVAAEVTPSASEQTVDVVRVVPALELELELQYTLTRWLAAGLRAGASLLLRPQRYLVRSAPVLELSRGAFEAGLVLALGLPD